MSNERAGILHGFENPFFVVVVLLCALFVGAPLLDSVASLRSWTDSILDGVACFALTLGIASARPPRAVFRVGVAVSILVVLATVVGSGTTDHPLDTFSRIGLAVLSMAALVTILRFVLRARSVHGEEIFAAIAAYLLLGFFWAYLYVALHFSHVDEPAFTGLDLGDQSGVIAQLNYYSFVTLTTLGYGDIAPANAFARSLATFEAVTGQIFIAVLLARLVALQTMNRRDG